MALFGSDTAGQALALFAPKVADLLPESVRTAGQTLSQEAARALAVPQVAGTQTGKVNNSAAVQPAQTPVQSKLSQFFSDNKTTLMIIGVVIGGIVLWKSLRR